LLCLGVEMNSLKATLASPRSYVIFAVIAALIAFFIPEYFDRLLLGGSIYPLGVFQRSFIAIVVGIFALLAGLALHLVLAFIWKDSFCDSRIGSRTHRRKARSEGSFEGGHSHSAETKAAGLFVGGEMSTSDTDAEAGSDGAESAGSESYGEAFGGGDAGGGGGGGDFGGGMAAAGMAAGMAAAGIKSSIRLRVGAEAQPSLI
jgi:hypothetical protein